MESLRTRRSIHLLRDIACIAAFVVGLFLSNWIGLQLCSLLVETALFVKQTGHLPGLILLAFVRGAGHVACGVLLGRWLYCISPWHVLAVVATVGIIVTPWTGHSELAAMTKIPVPTLVAGQIIGLIGVLAFVAMGICYGRLLLRRPTKRGVNGRGR